MTKSAALRELLLTLESAAATNKLPRTVRAAFEYYDNTPADLCHITEAGQTKALRQVGTVVHAGGTMRMVEWVDGTCPEVGAEIWSK
jgi:hypothetical protein